jgi:cellulose synthase/poly-beta-1,6-N-acetylglucosamine synthase-like glycosyltransferase
MQSVLSRKQPGEVQAFTSDELPTIFFLEIKAVYLLAMEYIAFAFWTAIAILGYTYLGYPLVSGFIFYLKKIFSKSKSPRPTAGFQPQVLIMTAAYNEAAIMKAKIQNFLEIDYPFDKLAVWIVTDGSTDATPSIVEALAREHGHQLEIRHFHQTARKGKMAALDRLMPLVESPLTVFTDANTLLNPAAIKLMVRHFEDAKTGVVAGEKRILSIEADAAAGAGEGLYWKYESRLKTWESSLHSTMGAAGELFAFRTGLYEQLPPDILTEDFVLTMKIAMRGYKIAYEPGAYAMETASLNTAEELKRKVRIAAGGLQSISRLRGLLNPFRYGMLSFQFISHRVLRWTLAPASLPFAFALNALLVKYTATMFTILMICQIIFYTFAIVGYLMRNKRIKLKMLFIPYYFCLMNFSMLLGLSSLVKGRQSVLWDKAQRAA